MMMISIDDDDGHHDKCNFVIVARSFASDLSQQEKVSTRWLFSSCCLHHR